MNTLSKLVCDVVYGRLSALRTRAQRRAGQGIVEYAGALVIAGLIIGGLISAAQNGNWLNQAYVAIFTAAQTMLVTMAGQIG